MKYSLWAGEHYVQSSDDGKRLQCNTNQLRTWCDAMSIDVIPAKLVVKDNQKDATLAVAEFTQGCAIRWKTPENARKTS